MVVSVSTRSNAPARGTAGDVSEASANGNGRVERSPFSREYLDYWAPLPEAAA